MAWAYLLLAGLLEVVWAVGLKYTHGFTRLTPSIWVVSAMAGSIWLLALAARALPIGTAYAVWTGIGTVGAAVLGIVLLREPHDWPRLICIGLIVLGIIGLRLTAGAGNGAASAGP